MPTNSESTTLYHMGIIESMKTNKLPAILIFTILVCLIFAFSWKDKIIFTDEIIYEDIAFTMYKTKDFLTPRLHGQVWLEKPPLYPWLTATIYHVAPPTPLTRRLVTIFSAIGILALTYYLARIYYQKHIATLTLVVLTTTPLFLYFTKTASLDMLATALITTTFLIYIKARKNPRLLLLAGAMLGLAVLTRSFMALTPIPAIIIDQLLFRKKKIPFTILLASLGLAIAVAAPWHLYIWQKHPADFQTIYIKRNINNYFQGQVSERKPSSIPKFLFDALFKFNPLAFLSLAVLTTKRYRKQTDPILPLWIANTFVPLTFAVNHSAWYTIQALPPLAVLTAAGIESLKKVAKTRLARPKYELLLLSITTIFLTLPTSVFLALQKEPRTISTLRLFIEQTPNNTPLYNIKHQFTPQSTLFNPRETPILQLDDLIQVNTPIYLYADNSTQYDLVKSKIKNCCNHEVIVSDQGAKILHIKPK